MKRYRLLFAAAVLLVTALSACKPAAQSPTQTTATTPTATTATTRTNPPLPDFPLDHYKFWKVNVAKPPKIGVPVKLKGQFDNTAWDAFVFGPVYVANPVEKRRKEYPEKPIRNEKLHYVARKIQMEEVPVPPEVLVTNQLGEKQEWTLRQPEWLLVPADKVLKGKPGDPPKGDHFVCYAATWKKQAQVAITLMDQFDRELKKPEEVRDFEAAYLCVPVDKQRKDKPVEEARDKRTHLALYKITPTKFERTVFTNDQFGRFDLPVTQSEYLGVPSLKEVIKKQK